MTSWQTKRRGLTSGPAGRRQGRGGEGGTSFSAISWEAEQQGRKHHELGLRFQSSTPGPINRRLWDNFCTFSEPLWAFLVAQTVKNPPAMWETQCAILGSGRSPGKGHGNPL